MSPRFNINKKYVLMLVSIKKYKYNYQVHVFPSRDGESHTLAAWIIKAPRPCFEVSQNHMSHGLLAYLGSQNRLPGVKTYHKPLFNDVINVRA